MEITELINHPERMDRDTLYELRSMLALHPYFQTARLLMLQNLYLLHDPAFDEELRRAAIYITDRKTIFQMIEAAHYQLRQQLKSGKTSKTSSTSQTSSSSPSSRTIDLIDTFLDSRSAEFVRISRIRCFCVRTKRTRTWTGILQIQPRRQSDSSITVFL